MKDFKHVDYLWDDAVAADFDPVGRLIYRSNILGQDTRITNTGGGNTSAKLMETDPLSGEQTEVLWVKGSGGDLRTAKRENFSSLYQEKLIGLQKSMRPTRKPAQKRLPKMRWWECILTPRSTLIRAQVPLIRRCIPSRLTSTLTTRIPTPQFQSRLRKTPKN